MEARVLVGTLVHATRQEPLLVLRAHALGVARDGKIAFVVPETQLQETLQRRGWSAASIRRLSDRQFVMPGLVDTHIHASQYSFAGTAVGLPLLEWLRRYTFNVEAKFHDLQFAEDVYTRVVRRTLKNGTTTACYFGTIHTDATLLLCDIADRAGQRAMVGKVCMDHNEAVPAYKETCDEAVRDTERFIMAVKDMKYARVHPVVTPRFALSCTRETMRALGETARGTGTRIQSHISESREEVELVRSLFPESENYTEVYRSSGLLTDKTVMAHGVHLGEEELRLFHEAGAGISHCPLSNAALCSGTMDAQAVLSHGVKLGLGTDVAGGYSASMLTAVRHAVLAAHHVGLTAHHVGQDQTLGFREAFRLATLGGSQVLGLEEVTGSLEVGKELDALLVDTEAPGSPLDIFPDDSWEDIIQKFLFLGDDRNILEVYVAGRDVTPRDEPVTSP
ncbi:guanine deaminase [Lampetra fluviatilis]